MGKKSAYTCQVCDKQFTVKRDFQKHERACHNMEVDSVVFKQPRKKIPAAVRFALWNATFGEHVAVGACHCCGRQITQQIFEAGHIISAKSGGSNSLDNLRIICALCNRSMGDTNMDEFISTHKNAHAT